MISLLFIISAGQVSQGISQNRGKPYYGVPLGALHYSDGNIRAEVYAANEYTIVFHRFTHRPRQLGCTSMIIGPPRETDHDAVNGSVFLSISQPMVASQSTKRRFIRQVPFAIFGMRNWPVEFDHLELRKDELIQIIYKDDKAPIPSQQKDPFAGIEIDMNSSEDVTPKTKDIHIEGIIDIDIIHSSTITTTNSNINFPSVDSTHDDFSSESVNEISLFDTNATNIFDGSEEPMAVPYDLQQLNPIASRVLANKNATTVADRSEEELIFGSTESTKVQAGNFHTSTEFEASAAVATTTHENEFVKNLLTATARNENGIRSEDEKAAANEMKNIVKTGDSSARFANDGAFSNRGNIYSLEQTKSIPHSEEKKVQKSNKLDRKDKGFPVMLGQAKSEKWLQESLRQQIVGKEIKVKPGKSAVATDDYILSDEFFETDESMVFVSTQNDIMSTTPLSKESTPLYWVIQDPRLEKRKRMELLKKTKHEKNLNPKSITATANESNRKVYVDRRYELPLIEDKTVVFSIANDAKITEYQWIALRDHCAQKTIPLLSLKGIDPPREEKIGPLLGQSHNVTSHRVQILNCNTIFIPNFVFNQGDDPPETYFYAGIGHFPNKIEKKIRAYVVGQPPDQPLRNYKGENVMIRLPKTYRTFDIDFISVFNEIEGRSYGHVVTPSLLVPPCNDYDAI
uniref:DM13 domain-containing protein n=1 Tax=Setaria digitata TaxID=48799 RepID=A0A915PVI6_9BILA